MNSIEISIQDILWSLKKYSIWIIAATLIGAVAAYCITQFFSTPVYSARVSFCVFANQREDAGVSNSDLAADATLANTYAILLTSEPVRMAVSEEMGGIISAGALSGMLSTSRPTQSQVIYVTIRGTNPQLVIDVGNTLLKTAPAKLSEIVRGGEMSAVDSARSAAMVSPNLTTNVVYGLLLGLVLSCAVVVVIAMLDTTIWREEDLERAFDIPVLGSVPSMFSSEQVNRQKSRR